MTKVSITIPTDTCQVHFELQGIPDSVVPTGPGGFPAALHAYMHPINTLPGSSICNGLILGNDAISISGHTGTYYLVSVIDYRTSIIRRQAMFNITGEEVNLDTLTPVLEAPSSTPLSGQFIRVMASDGTIRLDDRTILISDGVMATLPDITSINDGIIYTIKLTSSGDIPAIIKVVGTQLIDNQYSEIDLVNQNQVLVIQADKANLCWWIIGGA